MEAGRGEEFGKLTGVWFGNDGLCFNTAAWPAAAAGNASKPIFTFFFLLILLCAPCCTSKNLEKKPSASTWPVGFVSTNKSSAVSWMFKQHVSQKGSRFALNPASSSALYLTKA